MDFPPAGEVSRVSTLILDDDLLTSVTRYTILDEADEMIQPDWEEDMKHLLGGSASNL